MQEEGAIPLVQLSISFVISCFEKLDFYFFPFLQLNLKLIDQCTSGSTPFPLYGDFPGSGLNLKQDWLCSASRTVKDYKYNKLV